MRARASSWVAAFAGLTSLAFAPAAYAQTATPAEKAMAA